MQVLPSNSVHRSIYSPARSPAHILIISHLSITSPVPPSPRAIERLLKPSGGKTLPESDGLFGGEAVHRLLVEVWIVGAVKVEVKGRPETGERWGEGRGVWRQDGWGVGHGCVGGVFAGFCGKRGWVLAFLLFCLGWWRW
jgi:hypothetical protein